MKKKFIIRLVIYTLWTCFMLYAFRFDILIILNDIFDNKQEMTELTMEQKLEDFYEFYDIIVESVPYLEKVKELYGIDFIERKEYYIEEIMETESNVEYYGVMKAISEDLASFHTDICFPLYSNLQGLNCYNSKETVNRLGVKSRIEEWTSEIGKIVEVYQDINIIRVVYVDGVYIVDEATLPENYREKAKYQLISIDGIPADDYITQNISIYNLRYDYLLNKPYRTHYYFNDSVGTPVKIEWENKEGDRIEETLYLDHKIDIVAGYGYLYADGEATYVAGASIMTYRDDENQLEYIKINNFTNAEGKNLKKYLENVVYEKIVIDLRNNYGGQMDYAKKYIFPALYNEDVKQTFRFVVPESKANRAMTGKWSVRWEYKPKKQGEDYCFTSTYTYHGNQNTDREIYYLIGPNTGSAADTFVSMIQENDLGTVVGANTGGEGLGASYICGYLKNSSLIYVYYPSVPIDREENPCGGTAPDIYINQTREDFKLERQYRQEGVAEQYDKRLQYDTVLKWVIEQ